MAVDTESLEFIMNKSKKYDLNREYGFSVIRKNDDGVEDDNGNYIYVEPFGIKEVHPVAKFSGYLGDEDEGWTYYIVSGDDITKGKMEYFNIDTLECLMMFVNSLSHD